MRSGASVNQLRASRTVPCAAKRGRHRTTPSDALDEERRLVGFKFEEPSDARIRVHGPHDVLDTLQRRDLHQVFIRRQLREVSRQIVGCDARIDETILDLQCDVVFEMHDE
jgi:hypothetical protein